MQSTKSKPEKKRSGSMTASKGMAAYKASTGVICTVRGRVIRPKAKEPVKTGVNSGMAAIKTALGSSQTREKLANFCFSKCAPTRTKKLGRSGSR